jgi:hypothetical protein
LGTKNPRYKLGLVILYFLSSKGWDSVIYQISYQIVIYKPDPGMKILDKNCAELFTECNFSGESISICDKINSLPEKGWAKTVKSLTVPK